MGDLKGGEMMFNVCSDRPRLPGERIARIILFKLVINTKERDMRLYQHQT